MPSVTNASPDEIRNRTSKVSINRGYLWTGAAQRYPMDLGAGDRARPLVMAIWRLRRARPTDRDVAGRGCREHVRGRFSSPLRRIALAGPSCGGTCAFRVATGPDGSPDGDVRRNRRIGIRAAVEVYVVPGQCTRLLSASRSFAELARFVCADRQVRRLFRILYSSWVAGDQASGAGAAARGSC
jgi:hypothetical protein